MGAGRRIGRWAILDQVAAGSNGEVFRAEAVEGAASEYPVVLKLVRDAPALAALEATAPRLRGEEHPGVLPILDHGRDGDVGWIVTPLCAAGSLRDRLGAERPSPARAAAWLASILDALAWLHGRGLVHGDLKPENILFERSDGPPRLIDVSAITHASVGNETADDAGDELVPSWRDLDAPPPGSTAYAAPEKLRGEPPAPGHDVFAAGVILYEALTGVRPCGPERPSDLVPGLPAAADLAYAKLCARRERRPDAAAGRALLTPLIADAERAPSTQRTVRLAPAFRAISFVAPGTRVRLALPEGVQEFEVEGVERERAALLGPGERPGTLAVVGPAPPREWEMFLGMLPAASVVVADPTFSPEPGMLASALATREGGEIVALVLPRGIHRFDTVSARRLTDRVWVYERHAPGVDDTRGAALRDAFRRGERALDAFARLPHRSEGDGGLFAAYELAGVPPSASTEPRPTVPGVRLVGRGGGVDPAVYPPPG